VTFYRRPTKLTQTFNRLFSWFAALGLTPSRMITLEVKGRRSGQVRWNPLNLVEYEGQRCLVSPRGESEWVRNVRASGGEAVIRHGGRQKVRLEEVGAEERAPIIKAYLGENAMTTRQHFGVDPKAELSEFEAIAARHPVFRVVTATEGQA
jgi:deazaflavin-dependent oxidoreductase (nitroreductase family)